MKSIYKKIIIAAALFLPVVAYAASQTSNPYDKVTQGKSTVVDKDYVFNIGAGASNPLFRANSSTNKLQFAHDGTTFKDIGSGGAGGGGGGVLLNTNPGFEDGLTAWTASGGSFTLETTLSNVGFETQAGAWDASAASQTLSGDLVAIPSGLYGKVCTLSWYYKGGDANLSAQVYDGSSVIAQSSALSVQATYSPKQIMYFTCPSSGSFQARFISSADAALVYLDDVRLGQEGIFEFATGPRSEIYVSNDNGTGASATTIRRFSVTQKTSGTDITFADDATNASRFTINVAGIYAVSTYGIFTGATELGISVNQTTLTAGPSSVPNSELVAIAHTAFANAYANTSAVLFLNVGDVVRVVSGGSAVTGNPAKAAFRITKVSN